MNPATASLERGLDVLVALGAPEHANGLGVVALTELVDGDKSQLSRTLATLESRGLVVRDEETRAYRLGYRLFALAARVTESRLLAEAPPILRALVRDLGESAHLSVRQGDQVLTLLSESPEATLHAPGRVGALTPIANTATGRALVLDFTGEELDAIGLKKHRAAIEEARARGYALVREEFEPGLVAAAAPVRDAGGQIVAAVNVSAPTFRLGDRLESAAEKVVTAAHALSAAARR